MDAVLGVAVTGSVAHLALIGSTPEGLDVIDQSIVDVAADPIEKLTDTVVGTHRLLADENHRLVATGVCWSDQQLANELRRLLIDAGLEDIALLSESEAATALVPNASRSVGERTTSALPVGVADDFAIARGAAMAVEPATMTQAIVLPNDTTEMAPAAEATQMRSAEGEQLAYSMADDSALLPLDAMSEAGDDDAEAAAPRLNSRALLISNAVVAFAVISFAALAVVVAITIRPTTSQQPVQGHPNAAPGKFLPPLPTQQQAPLPAAPTGDPAAVLPPGSGLPQVSNPGVQQDIPPIPNVPPAPVAPPAPGLENPGVPRVVNPPNHNVPIPIPIPIPAPIPIPVPIPDTTDGGTTGPTTGDDHNDGSQGDHNDGTTGGDHSGGDHSGGDHGGGTTGGDHSGGSGDTGGGDIGSVGGGDIGGGSVGGGDMGGGTGGDHGGGDMGSGGSVGGSDIGGDIGGSFGGFDIGGSDIGGFDIGGGDIGGGF